MMVVVSEPERLKHFDGLRGVASKVVFASHLLISTLPALITFQINEVHTRFDIPLGLSPLRFLFSGNFAVCIFFVLSGYVLANLCVKSTLVFPAQVLRRYLRLAVPILITSAFAWILLSLDLFRNFDAAVNVTKSGWLSAWYQFPPNFFRMVWESLIGAFIHGRADYNCNLWTMKIELIGSLYVFLLHAFCKSSMLLIGLCLAYLIFVPLSYYSLFFTGALLYELSNLDSRQYVVRGQLRILAEALVLGVFFVGLWMGAFPELQEGMHSDWHSWVSDNRDPIEWHMFGAALVVAAVVWSRCLKVFFSSRVAVFLGKISFVFYLIHIPVICLVVGIVANFMYGQYYLVIVFLSIISSAMVAIGLSAITYKIIDTRATMFSRAAGYKIDRFLRSKFN